MQYELDNDGRIVCRQYIDDVEKATSFILGPRDLWGSEYYTIAEDVSCALATCVREGRLDESGTAQIRKDGEDVDCDWLLDSVVAAGAELAEKWKKYRNK